MKSKYKEGQLVNLSDDWTGYGTDRHILLIEIREYSSHTKTPIWKVLVGKEFAYLNEMWFD